MTEREERGREREGRGREGRGSRKGRRRAPHFCNEVYAYGSVYFGVNAKLNNFEAFRCSYTRKPPPLAAEPNNFWLAEKPPTNLQLSRKPALNIILRATQKKVHA